MKNKRMLIVAIVGLAVVGTYFWWFRDTPERQVAKALDSFCNAVDKEAGESKVTFALKDERLGRLVTDEIIISGDASILTGTHSSSEFLRRVQQGRFMFQTVDLDLADVAIGFSGDDTAVVDCTAKLALTGKGGQTQSQTNVRQLTITLVKIDGNWLLKEFNVVQLLER